MWARVVEIMLGFWLLASPFIFRFGGTHDGNLTNDLLCGLLIVIFGFLSFWNRTAPAHFLILLVAGWLIIFGYLAGHPAPPSAQNQIIVGLLLVMFAIIPNNADEMPEAWQKFYGGNTSA
jgi:peptidoglycan/LPS O-acetylase OafA/YrhL